MYSEDLIYFIKRSGTDINPFVDITEEIIVDYGRAFLKEIPSESFSVSAKNGLENMVLVDSADKILSSNDFYVDFKQGIIHLHSSINSKKIVFKYKGVGVLLYPSSRIYIEESSDKNVYTTLKDFIKQGKDILNKLNNVEEAVKKAEIVMESLNEITKEISNLSTILDEKTIEIDKLISDSKNSINEVVLDLEKYGKDKLDIKLEEISNNLKIVLTEISEEEIIRKANEYIRKENESKRELSELTRLENESLRVLLEEQRSLNENVRISNESNRVINEDIRISNENKRIKDISNALLKTDESIENSILATEEVNNKILEVDSKINSLNTSEEERKLSENNRILLENQRIIDENERKLSEKERKKNEEIRTTNENTRLTNEENRILSENIRIESQIKRTEDFNNAIDSYDKSNIEIQEVISNANKNVTELDNKIIDFDLNELSRKTSENNRVISENKRVLDENKRVLSENKRILDEEARRTAEENREINESVRKKSELNRLNNEEKRTQTMKEVDLKIDDFTLLLNSTKYISEFNILSQYEKNNIVSYNGSSYIAKKTTKSNLPIGSIADEFWGLLAQRGIDGEGSVSSVNGVFPNLEGDVTLDAHNLGFVSLDDLGVPNGMATLDKNGKLNSEQLPDLTIYETVKSSQEKINSLETSLKDYSIPKTDLGIPNGVARLNQDGKVIDGNGNEVLGKVLSVNGETGDVVLDLFSGDYDDLTNKPKIPNKTIINDTLISTSITEGLSANQGKVLDGKIIKHEGNIEIHVSNIEKDTWNNKSNFSGSYNDLTSIPTEFTPSKHPHTIDEITDLQTKLNDKASNTLSSITDNGLMSSEDKVKLNKIESEANKTIINNTLISTSITEGLSANQGKVLDEKIIKHESDNNIHVKLSEKEIWNNKADKTDLHKHDNKTVLDKLSENDGNILFDGKEIESGSIVQQDTAPEGIEEGKLWLDTSDNTFQGTVFENLTNMKIGNFTINYDSEKQSLNFLSNGISVLTINSNGIKVNGTIIEE